MSKPPRQNVTQVQTPGATPEPTSAPVASTAAAADEPTSNGNASQPYAPELTALLDAARAEGFEAGYLKGQADERARHALPVKQASDEKPAPAVVPREQRPRPVLGPNGWEVPAGYGAVPNPDKIV